MEVRYSPSKMSNGVTSLMYVGDDAASPSLTPPAMPSQSEIAVGAIGALLALFAKGSVARVAGGIAAGVVGYRVYQAKK